MTKIRLTMPLRTFDPDEMDESEFAAHYGRERSTDEYVAMVRHKEAVKLAATPALPGVPGAVVDAATEAKIGSLLGADLAAAVRRLFPSLTLSAWVSRNFGSIEALGKALTRDKVSGSPVNLSSRPIDAKAANAMVIQLEMNRR